MSRVYVFCSFVVGMQLDIPPPFIISFLIPVEQKQKRSHLFLCVQEHNAFTEIEEKLYRWHSIASVRNWGNEWIYVKSFPNKNYVHSCCFLSFPDVWTRSESQKVNDKIYQWTYACRFIEWLQCWEIDLVDLVQIAD